MCGCLLLAACSDSDGSDDTGLSDADASACQAFFDDLPTTIAGEKQSGVDEDLFSKAYGSPAMVVQCGVDAPEGFDATSECQEADRVGWYAPVEQYDDQSADVTIFAVTYEPIVELRLPGEYRPDGLAAALTDLAAPVKDHLTKKQDCI